MGAALTPPTRIHLRVTGTVQGVGFRWFVRSQARRLGVAGYVRNEADGSVELEAEGEPAQLERLRELVAHGPPGAAVTAVLTLPASDGGPLAYPFQMLR